METTIDSATRLGNSNSSVQVWFLLISMAAAVVWLIRQLRSDSEQLRAELKEQSTKRAEMMDNLARLVADNSATVKQNSEIIAKSTYQTQRCQEILEKISI